MKLELSQMCLGVKVMLDVELALPTLCPTVVTLCKLTANIPEQGSGTPACAWGHKPHSAVSMPSTFSSQLTLSQKHREQRQLYITVSAHTFISPSHPSCRDLVGQNHAWSLPSQMHLHKHCTGAPRPGWGGQWEGQQKRNAPPHHHTMS